MKQNKKKLTKIILMLLITFISLTASVFGGFIYNDFENQNGNNPWTYEACTGELTTEKTKTGTYSWKVTTLTGDWNYSFVPNPTSWNVDFKKEKNDRLSFWFFSEADDQSDHYVHVKIYDHSNYKSGFELISSTPAKNGSWSKLDLFLNKLPSDFDINNVDKLEFGSAKGIYYIDDIKVIREDKVYQSFDLFTDCGWSWGDEGSSASLSTSGEPVKEGSHSWKVECPKAYSGTGIKSQIWEKVDGTSGEYNYWNSDLEVNNNDRLNFWVYYQPYTFSESEFGTHIEVQFFDQGTYKENCVKIPTDSFKKTNEWVYLEIPFSKLPNDFDLSNIDKIQFLMTWPGTYYLDTIKASRKSGSMPYLVNSLENGELTWNSVPGATHYKIEKRNSLDSSNEWQPVHDENEGWVNYDEESRKFKISSIKEAYYRISFKEETESDEILYEWTASSPILYKPNLIVIDRKALLDSELIWNTLPQEEVNYEVQQSLTEQGKWEPKYEGYCQPLNAESTKWYRVRAVKNGEVSSWSPAQSLKTSFLKTHGTRIYDETNNEVTLRGVNLGGYLLLERWLTGLGNDELNDDYSIRERLLDNNNEDLLKDYQDSFIKILDLDQLKEMGVNFIRLPIYYRILQDVHENWILPDEFAFERIDWIIKECANRGIYVLLDLHGAPGCQWTKDHSGRSDYNQLFTNENYQDQTVEVWEKIASRYKDNPAVMGYDLLNEPAGYNMNGAPEGILITMYDRLYQAIREIDQNHIIVFEAAFDWDSLPVPAEKDWENIIYQFHWYHWDDSLGDNGDFAIAKYFDHKMEDMYQRNIDDIVKGHKVFINNKISEMLEKQQELDSEEKIKYNIPVMIGEFNCFESKQSWELYLELFNKHNLSWTIWNYKAIDAHSNWGLYTYTNSRYNGKFPNFEDETAAEISEKLQKFDTRNNYSPNKELIETIKPYFQDTANPELVAYYSFDGIENGQVIDQTSNGFDADLINNPSIIENCGKTNAMSFSQGNYLKTNKGNPLSQAKAFTVSLWYKIHISDPGEYIQENYKFVASAEWHGGDNATGWNVGHHYTEGWSDYQLGPISSVSRNRNILGNHPQSDIWNHLVIVYDGKKLKEYINGEPSIDIEGSGLSLGSGRNYMTIGSWDGGFCLDGLMDELKIYKGSLSKTQVEDLYEQDREVFENDNSGVTPPPTEPELVAYYNFEEVINNQVPDISENGYNAEIIGDLPINPDGVSGNSMNFSTYNYLQAYKGNPLSKAENFTVSLWFKTHLNDPQGRLPNIKFVSSAEWHGGSNATGWNVGLHYPEGWADNKEGSIHQDGNHWDRSVLGVYPKSDQWNHLVIVYNGDRIKEYLNGELSVDLPGSGRPLGSGRDYMKIGSWMGGFYFQNGSMDELRIYKGALSETKIQELYEIIVPSQPVKLWEGKSGGNNKYNPRDSWLAVWTNYGPADNEKEYKTISQDDLFQVDLTVGDNTCVTGLEFVHGYEGSPQGKDVLSCHLEKGSYSFQIKFSNNINIWRTAIQFDRSFSNALNFNISINKIDESNIDNPYLVPGNIADIGQTTDNIIPEQNINTKPQAKIFNEITEKEVLTNKIVIELETKTGSEIKLNALKSFDPDTNDKITKYLWISPSTFGEKEGAFLEEKFPLGSHEINLIVFDGKDYSEPKKLQVEVKDTIKPEIISTTPSNFQSFTYSDSTDRFINLSCEVTDASDEVTVKYFINKRPVKGNTIDLRKAWSRNILTIKATDSSNNETTKKVVFTKKKKRAGNFFAYQSYYYLKLKTRNIFMKSYSYFNSFFNR